MSDSDSDSDSDSYSSPRPKKQKTAAAECVEVPEDYESARIQQESEKTRTTFIDYPSKTAALKVSSSVMAVRSFSGNVRVSDEGLRAIEYYNGQVIHDIEYLTDLASKTGILKVSPSLVGLQSFTGVQELSVRSGIIIKCDECEGGESTGASSFVITILSCATLLVNPADYASLASDLKVKVHLYDKRTRPSWGEVSAVDLHYNLAVITMKSDMPIQPANLKRISDDLSIRPSPFLRPHDDEGCKLLIPGSKVIALARKCYHRILAFQFGVVSDQHSGLDCHELWTTTCQVYPSYYGGPLITSDGDVIGVNMSHNDLSYFLPSNIVSKCLDHLLSRRDVCRPRHGMTMASLYVADFASLERIIWKFPNVSKGAVVKKVERGSPAEVARVLPNDVIVRCNGRAVTCSLKLFEEIIDSTGKPIELEVVRETGERLKLFVLVEETTIYNRWPVYKR